MLFKSVTLFPPTALVLQLITANYVLYNSALAPTLYIFYNRIATTACNDPQDILIAIVDLLMLSIGRYKSEVARTQFLSL